MVRFSAISLFLLASSICLAANESKEPPLQYYLEIDSQSHPLEVGQKIKLNGTFTDPQVQLKASPTRTFTCGDISFDYPAAFLWEAHVDDPFRKYWFLTGKNFKLMYCCFSKESEPYFESYVNECRSRYGRDKTRVSECERMIGGEKHKGKHIAAKIVGTDFNMEIYMIPSKNVAHYFVFQDQPPEDSIISQEAKTTFELLDRTFKYRQPSIKEHPADGKK